MFVKLGSYTSPNLVPLSAEGKWTHTITISDQKGNWNETKAVVEFNGASVKSTVTLDLDIDKSCKEINLDRPVLIFQRSDSIRCEASISISGIKDDVVILSTEVDGTPTKDSYFDRNSYATMKLNPGIHTYRFTAKDQAENVIVLERDLGCFPKSSATINLEKGHKERLRIPPPPHGVSKIFSKTMRFSIGGVINQDPNHVKRVLIKKGNDLLERYEGSQQIKELNFDVPVNLEYGKTTVIDITVIMKNGKQISAQKIYEVR